MKIVWVIGMGIFVIILIGCTSNTSPTLELLPEQSELHQSETQGDHITSPSELQNNIMRTPDPIEDKQNESKLPHEISIDDWRVGVPFSTVSSRIPIDAELEEGNTGYRVTFEGLDLLFSSEGILSYVFTDEPGKTLNVNLKIGDDVQQMENVLGEPKTKLTTRDGYLVNTYSFGTSELIIYTKNASVQVLVLQLTEGPTEDESELIKNYYNNYTSEINSILQENKQPVENNTTQNDNEQETKDDNNPRTFTRTELMNLFSVVNTSFTLYQQTVYGSNGDSIDDKLVILEETFNNNNFWDIGVDLENAQNLIKEEDASWYNFIVSFMDAVDSAYVFQIFSYKMIQSGDASEQEIKEIKNIAAQESEKAIRLYDSVKGLLFP